MEKYIVRIVLHGADSEIYGQLHKLMESRGYLREITEGQTTFILPEAQYVNISDKTTRYVFDETSAVSDAVHENNSVFVTQVKDWAWYLPKKN